MSSTCRPQVGRLNLPPVRPFTGCVRAPPRWGQTKRAVPDMSLQKGQRLSVLTLDVGRQRRSRATRRGITLVAPPATLRSRATRDVVLPAAGAPRFATAVRT